MTKQIMIIGGMGPQASLELHGRLIERAVLMGAEDGGDFPRILHASLPIDDFISDGASMGLALRQIEQTVRRLYCWRRHYRHSLQYGTSFFA